MAGFFASQCFYQGLSKAMIKKGEIITIKPQWLDARNARFTWVARTDEENGRVLQARAALSIAIGSFYPSC